MKKLFTILFIGSLFVSCTNSTNKTVPAAAVKVSTVKTMELSVKGMTCEGCENTVQTSLTQVAGVTECTASFKEGKAKVKFDSTKTNVKVLTAAIVDAGYEVTGQKDLK
ncbi:MAG: cation transporter [Bacteroidota bacterium]